jgi:proteasome activator subunit 4
LPTFYQEHAKVVANSCLDDQFEISGLVITSIDVKAGFALTDPQDPRYRAAVNHHTRFGKVVHRAATTLRQSSEDHTDAVMAVAKAIDVFLLEYGMNREDFDKLEKSYYQTRE